MLPPRLKPHDLIGLASPSWLADPEKFDAIEQALIARGYRVRRAKNLFARGWGYAASPKERADDLNQLIRDPEVRMVFFGGGEGADDVIPLLDYEAARADPKLYLSFSDGTSILDTLWARTGVLPLYGQTPGVLLDPSPADAADFQAFTTGLPTVHTPRTPWHCLTPGAAEGTLLGGYLTNFIFLCATGRFPLDRRYVLFLEDHKQFFGVEAESAHLGRLEQCGILPHTAGLLFGHYGYPTEPAVLERLRRLGERWQIPVAYCDDFGHGDQHAILPIGTKATLDTVRGTLTYDWNV